MTVTATVLPGQASPLGQVEGEQGQQHVAVDDGAGVVDRDDPVGVAVEGQPEVGLRCATTARASSAGSVEPHFSLMLAPSGDVVQRGDRGAELGQHARGDLAGRAVGAVDHDAQAVETPALGRGDQVRAVERGGVPVDAEDAPPRARWAGGAAGPDRPARRRARARSRASTSVGSFVPSRLNSLMPLSPNGLCEAEITAPGTLRCLGHRGHAGGGEHAEVDDVGALRGQAGREGGLEQRARAAGVAADDEGRSGQDAGGGAPEGQRQLGGQLLVRDPAHAIGAEAGRRHCVPLTTAWSTAAPCGPSSGRTSSTPSPGRRG